MSRFASATVVLALACLLAGGLSAYGADTSETSANSESTEIDSARALVDAQKYDEALTALYQVDRQSPNNPDVLNLIGFSLRRIGKTDEALDYYDRALALNPEHRGANEYLGELYLETKQPEKAKERLEVLHQVCGDCEEFKDLQKEIDGYGQ